MDAQLETTAEVQAAIRCIYCQQLNPLNCMTSVPVIPRYLGGAFAPSSYQLTRACRRCQAELTRRVDACFERAWSVSEALAQAAGRLAARHPHIHPPLRCLGRIALPIPGMRAEEIAEYWQGPEGEQLVLIRAADDATQRCAGPGPHADNRAYCFLEDRPGFQSGLATLRDGFRHAPPRKVLGGLAGLHSPHARGFCPPTATDRQALAYLHATLGRGDAPECQPYPHAPCETAFMSKLALGTGVALFGEKLLRTAHGQRLSHALWSGSDPTATLLTARPPVHQGHGRPSPFIGDSGAVSILIKPGKCLSLTLCINQALLWTIELASGKDLTAEDHLKIGHGRILNLFEPLRMGHEASLPEYLRRRIDNAR
ncbi:MAG: hypothetical protein ABWY06_25135 [Pseudomonas sp.]|uniref:hypothetical protein n=1 Tax=Pseudomonas sp. TaxID=306 RepID=UPI00339B825B